MGRFILTLALTLVFSAPEQVRVISIYLHPRAAGNALTVGDIADIEGDSDLTGDIETISIDASVWSDGFIDRGEVLSLLESVPGPTYCIYGSAVRVESAGADTKTASVTSGENVMVFVVKNGVRVRLKGTALQQGNAGDMVRVKTGPGAVIEGRVMKDGTVEKIL